MKRTLTSILSLILALAMVFVFVGCDTNKKSDDDDDDDKKSSTVEKLSDEEVFVGDWTAEYDVADMINDEFAGEDEEMAKYLKISEFALTFNFEFDDEGIYTMEVDQDAFEDTLDSFKKDLEEGMRKYFEALLEEQGLDMSVDELLETQGMSFDDMLDEMFADDTIDELFSEYTEMETEGQYKVDDGMLYTSDDVDDKPDEDEGEEYEIVDNDTIELTAEGMTLTLKRD